MVAQISASMRSWILGINVVCLEVGVGYIGLTWTDCNRDYVKALVTQHSCIYLKSFSFPFRCTTCMNTALPIAQQWVLQGTCAGHMSQVWYTVLLQGPMPPIYISSLSPSLFCPIEYTHTVLPNFHIVIGYEPGGHNSLSLSKIFHIQVSAGDGGVLAGDWDVLYGRRRRCLIWPETEMSYMAGDGDVSHGRRWLLTLVWADGIQPYLHSHIYWPCGPCR